MTRLRMTAQSKSNIKAAVRAWLIPMNGGYAVELIGNNGTSKIENGDGIAIYSSMSAAKTAVKKHNASLDPQLKPTI